MYLHILTERVLCGLILKTNSLIDYDKLLGQFTQILGLQNISFSLISPSFPNARKCPVPHV